MVGRHCLYFEITRCDNIFNWIKTMSKYKAIYCLLGRQWSYAFDLIGGHHLQFMVIELSFRCCLMKVLGANS